MHFKADIAAFLDEFLLAPMRWTDPPHVTLGSKISAAGCKRMPKPWDGLHQTGLGA